MLERRGRFDNLWRRPAPHIERDAVVALAGAGHREHMASSAFSLYRADTLAIDVGVDAQLGRACVIGHGAWLLADMHDGERVNPPAKAPRRQRV